MEREEAACYYLIDGARFANAAGRERLYVLDKGRWVESSPIEELSKTHEVAPIGSGELENLCGAYDELKGFIAKSGMGDLSRQLFLNADAAEIAELLHYERKELPGRTKMRGVYKRLLSQHLMFEDEIEDMRKETAAKAGATEGSISLLKENEDGASKNLMAVYRNGMLSICGREEGSETEAFHGQRVYGYAYSLDKESTERLHEALKAVFPGTREILQLCKKAFSGPKGCRKFKDTCASCGVGYEYESE